jgi:DNA-binding IclR family transcriptional regulator
MEIVGVERDGRRRPVDESPDTPPARARGHRPPQGEAVLRRAARILEAFDDDNRHLSLGQISARAELPISTASRLASQLVALGMLDRDPSGTFGVGLRLWELASLAEPTVSLRGAVAPLLDDLVAVTRQHVQLVVRDDDEAVVLDRRDGQEVLPVHYYVGGHVPLVPTAAGMVLLAAGGSTLLESLIEQGDYRWPTFESPRPSGAELREQVAQVRRTDVAVLRRPTSPVVSVGVPVRDRHGRVVAAIGMIVPADGLPESRIEPLLRAAGRAASRAVAAGEGVRAHPDWSRS